MFGNGTRIRPMGPREARKHSSWLPTLFVLLLVVTGAYYVFSGVENSYEQVQANEAIRTANQAPAAPQLSSRTETDKQRSQTFGNAIKNSPGLDQSQKHLDETIKLMQAASGNTERR